MEIITAISILTAKHKTSHAEKLAAVQHLATLAELPQNRQAIAAAGSIPPLVALVADESEEMMLEAAHVLAWLAANCENRQAIIEAGGIEPLVLLLERGKDDAQKEAANALGNLAASPKNSGAIAAAGAIPALVNLVATGSPEAKEEAALALEYLKEDTFCMAIAGAAAAARLCLPSASPLSPRGISVEKVRAEIQALESSKEDQKAKAAEQLGTWATVSDENRAAISREGGVEALVSSLVNGGDQAKWHASRALRNLANNPKAKEAILKAGGVPALGLVAKHGRGKVKEAADDALKLFSQQDHGQVSTDAKCDSISAAEPASELPHSMSGVSAADAKSEPEPAPELPDGMSGVSGVSGVSAKFEPTPAAEPAPELPDGVSGVSAADGKSEPIPAAEPAAELPDGVSGVSAADGKSEPTPAAEPAPELPDGVSGVSAADAKSEPTPAAEPAPELPDGVSADGKSEPTPAAEPAPELPDGVYAKSEPTPAAEPAAELPDGVYAKSEPTPAAEPAPELPDGVSGVSAADAKSEPTPAAEPAPELPDEPTPAAEPAPELPPDSKSCLAAVAVADVNTAAGGAADNIPSGEGTRVAMFSARFDKGPIEQKFRKVFQILVDRRYDILMVEADAGESFADLTTEYLWRLKTEQGTLLAVCTKHYGEMTDSSYSSHKELKFALDYERYMKVFPLKVEDTYPPEPPGGPGHEYDKKHLAQAYIGSVFKPGVVYLDCRDKSEREIAVEIAQYLQKHRVGTAPD